MYTQSYHGHVLLSMHSSKSYIVEPPNKGHVEDNTNSLVLSFVYREVVLFSEVLSVLRLYNNIGKAIFGNSMTSSVLHREFCMSLSHSEYPLLEVSLYKQKYVTYF